MLRNKIVGWCGTAAAMCAVLVMGCVDATGPDDEDGEPLGQAEESLLTGYQVVSGETAVTTVTVKQISVACPAGTKALGAGFAALDSTSAILNGVATYSLPSYDGSSWLTNARIQTGAPSWKLKVSVLCASSASLTGYQVTTADTALGAGYSKQLSTACPAGKKPTGAGFGVLDSTNAILDGEALYFSPSYNGSSWLTNARLNGGGSWKLRVSQICVDSTALPSYQIVSQDTPVSTVTQKQLQVTCPSGKKATGAGWGVLDSTSAILDGAALYSLPAWDGGGWLVNATNYSAFSPSWKLRVQLICN